MSDISTPRPKSLSDKRADAGRKGMASRYAPMYAEREAAGLPPTKGIESGRTPRFLDLDEEPYWISEAHRLGLVDPSKGRTALRALAKRLAVAATDEIARASSPVALIGATADDDVKEAYLRAEVDRWRNRAKRDRAMAATHDGYAFDAEQALSAHLLARGRLDDE